MPIVPFHPHLTRAECEFWFEAGADWQEQTERQVGAQFASVFADIRADESFLRFEPNYLAVLSGPLSGAAAHTDVEAHSSRVLHALAAYQAAAQPRRVQTLFLSYQFRLEDAALPGCALKRVWNTPRDMITLEWGGQGDGSGAPLEARCLITHPPACCLTQSPDWLGRIQHKMERAFSGLCREALLETARRGCA